MRRFYAPKVQFHGESVDLGPEESRHLRDVLRLHEGSKINVFDGEGSEYHAEISQITKTGAVLKLKGKITPTAPESDLDLTLAVSILKGEKFDLVVQKAVELGVRQVVPLLAFRGDVRPKDTLKRTDRWRRIALEAAKQSGRAALMEVCEPVEFGEFTRAIRPEENHELLMFSERGGAPFSNAVRAKKMTALIGPEGGWEDSEIDIARNAGLRLITLGGRILRAETAAISAATILQHRFGDLR